MTKRLCMTLGGVVVCAFSVGMFRISAFGVDPFQCFAHGIHNPLAQVISFGSLYTILNLLLLVAVFFLDRHKIGIATFINLFLTGYICDFSEKMLGRMLPDPSLGVRFILLLLAVVIMCVGSALYFTSNLGVSTYDAIALSLGERKLKVFGHIAPFKFIRIFTDCVCVIIGTIFGEIPGLGTIVTAFFMGPLIDFFNRHLAEPMLYGKGGKQAA